VWNGDNSSPAVSDTGVYVSYSCNQAYDFEPLTGALIWHHSTGCAGGGGKTTALSEFGVFTRDFDGNLVLDRNTGHVIGVHRATYIPAFAGKWRYSVDPGALKARRMGDAQDSWTFDGDGALSTAPIVVNGVVFVGSAGGRLYALNRRSGAVVWITDVGASISAPDEQNVSSPLTGLAAGEGIIVVPAGRRLVAYGN
jgi:outer membrane protein assembly factor BamB